LPGKKNIKFHQPLQKNSKTKNEEWEKFYNDYLDNHNLPKNEKFDIGIVCSFGYMIPNKLIEFFTNGMYVIHPSLLPKYRGASPIQYALLNGDKETGVSIIEISKDAFDKGKVLFQEKIEIHPLIRYQDLALELATRGGTRLIDVLEDIEYYKLNSKAQNETGYEPSKAPKFSSENVIIKWNNETNHQIFNKYRAFHGSGFTVKAIFNEGWYFIREMGIVLPNTEEAKFLEEYPNAKPGSIWVIRQKKYKNLIYVKCLSGWINILAGCLEPKQEQESYKFLNQYIDKEKIFSNKLSEGYYFYK